MLQLVRWHWLKEDQLGASFCLSNVAARTLALVEGLPPCLFPPLPLVATRALALVEGLGILGCG